MTVYSEGWVKNLKSLLEHLLDGIRFNIEDEVDSLLDDVLEGDGGQSKMENY